MDRGSMKEKYVVTGIYSCVYRAINIIIKYKKGGIVNNTIKSNNSMNLK
jgi:hypothetical protein